jgi:hypothetical protein
MLAQVTTEVEPFIDVNTWLLLLGLVTPFVTAILTRVDTNDTVKGAVSALVTALVAFVITGIEDGDLTWQAFVNGWLQILFSHAGSWLLVTSKPVEIVNARTPGVIGGGDRPGPVENPEHVA